jgi:hypothetical protein
VPFRTGDPKRPRRRIKTAAGFYQSLVIHTRRELAMAKRSKKDEPENPTLSDPKFLEYLIKTFPNEIVPDKADFDFEARAAMELEQAEKYRLAQAQRLLRLFEEWKAKQK